MTSFALEQYSATEPQVQSFQTQKAVSVGNVRVTGDVLKSMGQQLTLDMSGEWKTAVMSELRGWLAQRHAERIYTMTFEQFRAQARNQPTSHKSWGALATMAKNAGLIEFDCYVKAESAKTHSHPVARWTILRMGA